MKRSVSGAGLAWLGDYVTSIDAELSRLQPRSGLKIDEAVSDALLGGGKRVRAVLALLWCEVFSGSYRRAIPIAAAYELAHATALIQDDIIDGSRMRRGRASTVGKYGILNAILASDMMLFSVPKKVAEYRDLDGRRLCKLFDLVGEACRATTLGEFLDLEMAKRDDVTEEDYFEMIRLKTASLLGAPAGSGAILGGATEREANAAYRFGELVGMAYQIQDDLLDLMGNEEDLGKPAFTDMRGGKKNLVTIYASERCTKADSDFLGGLFGKTAPSDRDVRRARDIFHTSGAVAYARTRMAGYVAEAKRVLAKTRACRAVDHLDELTDYLSERYF